MIDEMGRELRDSNEKIVECIVHLKEQKDELEYLIEKQYEERKKLETEMERITYKLCLINKSLGQRERAKGNYDKTLTEIEEKYNELVKTSGDLLIVVQREYEGLDSIINKKTSTDDTQMGEEERCCPIQEKECKCEERKEMKTRKQAKPQAKTIEIELPIKLEKDEESVSAIESIETEVVLPANDDVLRKEDLDNKDEESDDEHDYTLHFRKYS